MIILRTPIGYLRRKKIVPDSTPLPTFEEGVLHSHYRQVTLLPQLKPVDSPSTRVITE